MLKSEKNTEKQKKKTLLSAEALSVFSEEMAMLLTGGVSASESLLLMLKEPEDEKERAFLEQLQASCDLSGSLAQAVEESGVFPDYYVRLLFIGEQTGKTDEVLSALAAHYAREQEIRRSIRRAVGYPLMMALMMLVIIAVLVTQVMPVFARVFAQLGSSLTGIAGGFLALGLFLNRHAAVLIVILVLLAAAAAWLFGTASGRNVLLSVFGRRGRLRTITDRLAAGTFASALSLTLASGMDLVQAVEEAGALVTLPRFASKLAVCRDTLADSRDLGEAFAASEIFGGAYGRMAVLSVRAGHVEQTLAQIADASKEEAEDEIYELIALIEPTLVIVLSVIVGLILLSVMLPLLSIMAGLG